MFLGRKTREVNKSKAIAVPRLVRGAADVTRPRRGVGAAAGDYCPGGCPTDGEGRVHHKCGYPAPANAQVFTDIITTGSLNPTVTIVYNVTSGLFCPEFFMMVPGTARKVIVNDIFDQNGDSLLLGPNDVMGEFFESTNDRGNRIQGCCVPAGLSISVEVTYTGELETDGVTIQGSFWGAIR